MAKVGLSTRMPRMKAAGSNFSKGKVSIANGASKKGGAAGSGSSTILAGKRTSSPSTNPIPGKLSTETRNRKNIMGSPTKQVAGSNNKGKKPFGGKTRHQLVG